MGSLCLLVAWHFLPSALVRSATLFCGKYMRLRCRNNQLMKCTCFSTHTEHHISIVYIYMAIQLRRHSYDDCCARLKLDDRVCCRLCWLLIEKGGKEGWILMLPPDTDPGCACVRLYFDGTRSKPIPRTNQCM